MNSNQNAIEIKGLTKRYRDLVAVDNLNLSIKRGELFSLLGVNGAGKSTTIKMLSCLISPDEGDADILGSSILTSPIQVKANIGVSPQETAVAANLSVRENLELICKVHSFSKDKSKERIERLAHLLSIDKVLTKRANKLSGGYSRRLSIAMALICEPKVLFLDEPTLGLDVLARSELWDVIKALKGEVTIILTTHYMEEAEALSDRIAIMKDGKILLCDTSESIKSSTQTKSIEEAFIKIVKEAKE